ncbi:MAG: hypothetical protein ACI91O_001253 [Candidatus Poriferisodalaceae bacterium]
MVHDARSVGPAHLGIGSGWFEAEHDAFGIPFNSFTERFEKLEGALNIIAMLRGERPTVNGQYYQVTDVINEPAPISRIPVMIGGSGEKKTLRMVAQYADKSIADYIALQGWPAEVIELVRPRLTIGDADFVGEAIGNAMATGIDGICLNLPANAHDLELVALAGQTADAAIG